MKILAVDTSSSVCAVAVLENENVIKENLIDDGRTHSENFMPLVKLTLEECNLNLDDIDLIACCVGPGSFTGIRIGIASIKAISEIKNIPIASVTSLESLAYNIDSDDVICSVIDARNNQVYCGIFDKNHQKIEDYLADDINDIINYLKKYNKIIFVGNGSKLHKNLINEKLVNVEFSKDNQDKQNAISVGKCGYFKYKKGIIDNSDTINPLYLRKSQAERMKEINGN